MASPLSWLLLVALTGLAAFAALAVTVRAEPEGRAEAGVLWTACFYALVCGPVLVLGYASWLYRGSLAAASVATSIAAFAASARGRPAADHARATLAAARAIARLPGEAFGLTRSARSFALLGLAGAAFAVVASAWLSYLAPSESWDGFFYHEPMVGFAIQNHGFRMVSLPRDMVVQAANGYPRLCESFALWFVIFTDKTLIEIGDTVAAPGLLLAVYVLARRYSSDCAALVGWSAAVLLVPAMLSQMRTSMIDVEVTFFLLAAVHFATRPRLRVRDAAAATLATALVVASKSPGLAWAPPIVAVAYGRLLWTHGRARPRAALALAVAGSAALAGIAALTFARNWLAFGSPLWPLSYDNPRLHIHWPGLVTLARITPSPPLSKLLSVKYGRPTGGVGDIIARDYGYGVPWVVLPLAAVSLVAALATAARARLRRRPDAATENLLLVALLGAAFVAGSPSLNIARFNVHVVAIAMLAVAWAAGRLRDGARFHEGAVAATLVMTMVPMAWTDWFFQRRVADMVTLLRSSPAERAVMNVEGFEMPADVARMRERELGPGDLVVFTQPLAFPGVLWNHAMSNRVAYVELRSVASFLAEVDWLRPKWVIVGVGSPAARALREDGAGKRWERVGTAVAQDRTEAYRRRGP